MNFKLHPAIFWWILLPLTFLALTIEAFFFYLLEIFYVEQKIDLKDIQKAQFIKRSQIFRKNSGFLPNTAFQTRKQIFLTNGFKFLSNFNQDEGWARCFTRILRFVRENPKKSLVLAIMKAVNNLTSPEYRIYCPLVAFLFGGKVVLKIPFWVPSNFNSLFHWNLDIAGLHSSHVSAMSTFHIILFGFGYYLLPFIRQKTAEDNANNLQLKFLESYKTIKNDLKGCYEKEMTALLGTEHEDEMGTVADSLTADYQFK